MAATSAPLQRLCKSAPVYPWHRAATTSRSTSSAKFMRLARRRRILQRASTPGTEIAISRSKRPGRRSAGSTAFGRVVMATTATW